MSDEPDFSKFADWLVDTLEWGEPDFDDQDTQLTVDQKKIVEKNAKLLLDKEAWRAHVDAFEEQLDLIKDEDERSQTRARYQIRFDRHTFPDYKANFFGFHFPCSVSFSGATFGKGLVTFSRAKFGDGTVSFSGTTFGERVVGFHRTIFGDGDVWFSGAKFGKGGVSFYGTTFGKGDVWFSGAIFRYGRAKFNRVRFGVGDVWFDNIKLIEALISFEGIDVGGNLFVRGIHFPKEADFQRASVKGTADFSRNTFHEVPDFRDTVFARPPEVAGMEVPPPKMKVNKALKIAKYIPAFNIAKNKEDVAKYRQLKKMALAANDHEKDIEFFAYEMRAKRGREKGSKSPFALFINWLYFTFSNFGQSYLRPLVCLGISLVAFIVPYAWMVCSFLKKSDAFYFALVHSWRNFTPLTNSLFRFATRPEDHPSGYDKIFHDLAHDDGPVDLLINIGIFQNFIGLILLFLLLLGLRNKFRLK